MANPTLDQLRKHIDALDEKIQALLNERASCAQQVAEAKRSEDPDTVFYRPEREAEVLRMVRERNNGPLSDDEVARLFREIMSACLALEQPLTIAYLGPEGTYTQEAALKHFGHSVQLKPLAAIDEIFREVEAGSADFGVVPVENSIEGAINHTLDMFIRSPLKICGDVELRIHHQLITNSESLAAVKSVHAHQQALAQCREWLDANLPGVERVAVSSNGEAARQASEDSAIAAIASDAAAETYGLDTLASNIEDDPNNTTRFLVVGDQSVGSSGNDKTTLMVTVQNEAGALYSLLEPVSRHGVSMTKIESRPSRMSKWDYVFFVDVEGHRDDESVAAALKELETRASMLKVLGSYPKCEL
ncbi:chorismate mutase [Thiogranum longum]|uniref:Bifunctional chorismate mutase/prephenate dehydratase n=1 Tax=Thiogranum longum TaxID=1537524 RepID=A0A4V6NDB3_9GAMM|nr:prephenate dehydratase [Thiogranum longum]TCK18086.1 chorismate mutase [Thiogranum longum]